MTNENDEAALRAVEQATQEVVEGQRIVQEHSQDVHVDPQQYRIEGVDLSPAFTAILDQMVPVRNRLVKSLVSATARNFTEQRDDLVLLQSLIRAYDVLAGYMTPDGKQLAEIDSGDIERQRRVNDRFDKELERTRGAMQQRAEVFSNAPIEATPRMFRPVPPTNPPPVSEFAPKKRGGWLRG